MLINNNYQSQLTFTAAPTGGKEKKLVDKILRSTPAVTLATDVVETIAQTQTAKMACDFFAKKPATGKVSNYDRLIKWLPPAISLYISGQYVKNALKNPKIEEDRRKNLAINLAFVGVFCLGVTLVLGKLTSGPIKALTKRIINENLDQIKAKKTQLFLKFKSDSEAGLLSKLFAKENHNNAEITMFDSLTAIRKGDVLDANHPHSALQSVSDLFDSKEEFHSFIDNLASQSKGVDFTQPVEVGSFIFPGEGVKHSDDVKKTLDLLTKIRQRTHRDTIANLEKYHENIETIGNNVGVTSITDEEVKKQVLGLISKEAPIDDIINLSGVSVKDDAKKQATRSLEANRSIKKVVDYIGIKLPTAQEIKEFKPTTSPESVKEFMNFLNTTKTIMALDNAVSQAANQFAFRFVGPVIATPAATIIGSKLLVSKAKTNPNQPKLDKKV